MSVTKIGGTSTPEVEKNAKQPDAKAAPGRPRGTAGQDKLDGSSQRAALRKTIGFGSAAGLFSLGDEGEPPGAPRKS